MPPEKKTTKVGSVKHPAGITVDLNVDRDSRVFFGTVDGGRIEHRDGKDAERLILEAIDRWLEAPWAPLIMLTLTVADRARIDLIGIEYHRVYVADVKAAGGLRVAPWDTTTNAERIRKSTTIAWRSYDGVFSPPCMQSGWAALGATTERVYYLPYSEELWKGLIAAYQAIGLLRERIDGAIGSLVEFDADQMAARLIAAAMPMLVTLPVE